MYANGYDERTSGSGCSPDGCVPYNTRDGSRSSNSRWSCQGEILDKSDRNDGCCISYYFEEPQDIVDVKIAFHQGNKRTRCLDVFNNGKKFDTIESSGKTNNFETFNLYTDETAELKFCLCDPKWNEDVWLSITEVRLCYLLTSLGHGCRTYTPSPGPLAHLQCELDGRVVNTVYFPRLILLPTRYIRTCLLYTSDAADE